MERLKEYINSLKNEVKSCFNECDGACSCIENNKCKCKDSELLLYLEKLAEYEQAEEDGLLPRFHLGDEFWCLYIDEVVKAKIVTLQQKKDGSWNYTLSREISKNYHDIACYKEREYGKYFWYNKAEAEQALAKMKGEGE